MEGRYGEAAPLFRQLAPTRPEALLGLGLSLYRLKEYQDAAKALEAYAEVGKGEEKFLACQTLFSIYYETDHLNKALRYAEEALLVKDDPNLKALYQRALADRRARGNAIREESAHFTVIFDGYAQGRVSRTVLSILEDAYSEIGGEFRKYPSGPVIVLLYSKRDFDEILQAPEWAGGSYDGRIRIPVRGIDLTREGLLRRVLFHEYTHALVHSMIGDASLPVWINEGLAEYFSERNSPVTGHVVPLKMLEGPFVNLGMPPEAAYAESYSAVKYLIDRYGLYRMQEFLENIGGGEGLNEAFNDAYSMDYNQFVASWGK